MLQSQGLIEIQRARQSPSLGPLGCPRISVCGYIRKSGPAHNRLPEADVESSRRLVQETAFWNFGRFFLFVCLCLFFNFSVCRVHFNFSPLFRLLSEEPHSRRWSVPRSFGSVFSPLCTSHAPHRKPKQAAERGLVAALLTKPRFLENDWNELEGSTQSQGIPTSTGPNEGWLGTNPWKAGAGSVDRWGWGKIRVASQGGLRSKLAFRLPAPSARKDVCASRRPRRHCSAASAFCFSPGWTHLFHFILIGGDRGRFFAFPFLFVSYEKNWPGSPEIRRL